MSHEASEAFVFSEVRIHVPMLIPTFNLDPQTLRINKSC